MVNFKKERHKEKGKIVEVLEKIGVVLELDEISKKINFVDVKQIKEDLFFYQKVSVIIVGVMLGVLRD